MIVDILLEDEIFDINDIFNFPSFNRNALIVFINAVNNHNYDSHILDFLKNERGLILQANSSLSESSRMGSMVVKQDDSSSIDVIGIVTRLYETDVDYEPFIKPLGISELGGFNGEHTYDRIFVEYKNSFEYNWLVDELDHHNINLVN